MDCKSISTSSSSGTIAQYDVFVSFRGETRNNFADHLFGALHGKGIRTFKDTQLKKGKSISRELVQAIEGSRVLIVVFSKNYASSTWCLRELAKMVDCKDGELSGNYILPIFYDVDPSEVRKQSGNYEKAFLEHEERFKEDSEMMVQVQRWREALEQVASLSGWDVRNKPQHAMIKEIVQVVTSILGRHRTLSLPNDLVGMSSRVEQLEKLLLMGSGDDVRVIGICGMGGIGKTTLATVVYGRISHQYDGSCFINVTSKIITDYGPIGAHQQLLHQTLNEENLQICDLPKATSLIRTRLRHVKVLIVLDNVNQVEQLEELALNRECLGAGSRIIIISTNEHILREHGVDDVYKVQPLNFDNSFQLFCRKAFKSDDIVENYEKLANQVLSYADGHPLAIKVLGSFLFGRNVFEWRNALARLRENPKKNIMDVLRISFDGLEEMEKEIFLDIACFFYKVDETYLKEVLNFRGFFPDIGLRILIDKSLITRNWGMIYMHDLLKELGRSIVREKSPKEPRKWSRLWDYKDLDNVMQDNMAAENLEAIVLQRHPAEIREKTMKADALSQMTHLKLLMLWNVNFSGCVHHLSNELGYLSWDRYPFTCLPSGFQPDKLVELILPHSSIKQLWEGTKPLYNLKRMDLSHSKNLIKMPDFSEAPNLEWLNLEGCIKLMRIDPSVGILRKLAFLNLRNCKNLVSIPDEISGLSSLEVLILQGCSKLSNKPSLVEHLKKPDVSKDARKFQSTSSIFQRDIMSSRSTYSRTHKDLVAYLFPSSHCFPRLRELDISFCNLRQIPEAIGLLHSLESLNLGGNNFVRLPCCIRELSKLLYLNLEHCKQLKYLPELSSPTVLSVKSVNREFHSDRLILYIFNCPKLGEMERCRSMTFSWMIQAFKAIHESSEMIPLIDIIIPGSQIPWWFNYQSVGGSIRIDPSLVIHDNNWIGIACCVVFVAYDGPTSLSYDGHCYLGIGLENKQYWNFATTKVLFNRDLVTVGSDHIWLFYYSRKYLIRMINNIKKATDGLDGLKLGTIIKQPQGLHLKVKNCGYRWVFKQDLEHLNPTVIQNGSDCSGIQILSLEAGN